MTKRNYLWLLLVLVGGVLAFSGYATSVSKEPFIYPTGPIEGKSHYFAIAENGLAKCCMVIPATPQKEEVAAARMLQIYLQLATGATFSSYKETAIPSGLNQIHVGETKLGLATPLDLPSLQYDGLELPHVNGYLIKTVNPHQLVIRGASPQANVLGAVGLLKRYFGIRRYWPGEPGGIGDVVPKQADLQLPQIEWKDWPYFVSRIMSGLDNRGPKSTQRTRFADFWRMNYTIPSNESYYRLLNARERTNEPDVFPLINGKRHVPHFEPGKREPQGWQPCVSNPKVAEIMAEAIKEYFRANPDKFAVSLSVNDGLGDCTCEKCRAMDAPNADIVNRIGLCDRYIKFDNQVATFVEKEFPDKILAFIAYGSMKNPPSTVQLHPMLMPVLCDTGNIFQAWDTWQKMGAKKMGAYFYHDDMWFIIPKLDIHQSAKRIRYIAASGLARSFYQEFYGIYPLNGMVGYVEQELTWDPRQNVDDLLNEYYHGFYGLAWKSMQSFYELLEADYHVWLEKAGKPHPHGPDISSIVDNRTLNQFAVLSESTAEKAQLALDAAWVAAKDEPLVRERISVVKTLFDFAVPGSQMFGARERLHNANIQSVSDADEIMADARKAVDSSLALAAYKTDVMEKSEAKSYADHGNRDKFYNGLEKGAVLPEVLNTISVALKEVAEYLNQSIGNEKANAWWQVQLNQETREVLKNQMRVAIFDASGRKLENRVQDPGFETRGTQQLANTDEDEDGHLKYGGANVWRSGGTQMQCSLTSEEAHNGKYSFTFSQTASAGVSEPFTHPLQTGDILRMSVWVKHNAGQAKYSVQTDPRSTSGQLPRATVEVPWKPDEWQQIELLATVVPGTVRMNFWVFVKGQDPEARIWVDDFFIGKYPDLE